MTTRRQAKAKLHAEDTRLKEKYDRFGPRCAAIGELIDARERLRVSQSELARRMNVKPSVASRIESAQHSPRLDTLITYAGALGLDARLSLKRQAGALRPVPTARPTPPTEAGPVSNVRATR